MSIHNKTLPLAFACLSMMVFNVSALVKGILLHETWRVIAGCFGCLCMIVVALLVIHQSIKDLKTVPVKN